jgi:Flp pilus assembly pilin Flp
MRFGSLFVSIGHTVRRLLHDEDGQDVVEYALLTAFLGLCALTAWTSLQSALGANYTGTTTGVQSLWEPPPPSGGGSP